MGTRFSDSEHVSSKFSEFGVRSFGKRCSEWEHVFPTQNTFLRNFRSSEFGVSEKRVLSGNTFLRLRTRFSRSFRSSEFGVSEKRVLSGNTFLRLRTRSSEIFGVRSFGKTCSEWEHVSPTQNTFLRLRTRFSEIFGDRSFGKTCSEGNTFLRPRTRFYDSEHVSPKFSGFGVRSFGKKCSEWEHVFPTKNTFLWNFRSSEFGVSEKRVLSGNTFLRPRTRFTTQNTFLRNFGVRSSEFPKNVF